MTKDCSEFGESKWIADNVQLPASGFLVDVGCAWPFLYSCSAFLRERGWSSCNIDGNPIYAPQWQGVAPFTNCVIGDGQPIEFQAEGVPELSRVGSGILTPTKRLDDLLQFSPHVDALLCDLEGHEFEALKTFDWQKNSPLLIVSEHSTFQPETQTVNRDERVRNMLLEMGYFLRHETTANYVFTK